MPQVIMEKIFLAGSFKRAGKTGEIGVFPISPVILRCYADLPVFLMTPRPVFPVMLIPATVVI